MGEKSVIEELADELLLALANAETAHVRNVLVEYLDTARMVGASEA